LVPCTCSTFADSFLSGKVAGSVVATADKMMAELRDQRAKLDLAEDERERAEALRNYMRG